jgi:hypothetical protein
MTERLRNIIDKAEEAHRGDLRGSVVRAAARHAASEIDRLASLPDEGDPRYADWWYRAEAHATLLAGHARAVIDGLKADATMREIEAAYRAPGPALPQEPGT